MSLFRWLGACALGLAATGVAAKPIAYARGWTVMAEYGADRMIEAQAFYAPQYWWSAGAGWAAFKAENGRYEHRVTYTRANALVRRWNLPAAQANVFAWGGFGGASGSDFEGTELAVNAGFQVDYETRRVYTAARSDWQYSGVFSHRVDTVQFGWAPYAHDYETLATWLLVQGRYMTGELSDDGIEPSLMLRFFRGPAWLELGSTFEGRVQAMLMFNF